MTPIVLDTDVASAILRVRIPEHLAPQLTSQPLAVSFVTVGELTQWTFVRQWGPQRRAGLSRFYDRVVVLPYSVRVANIWGEIQTHAQLRGRPRPDNDSWIAACCLAREFPLATLNIKDYVDFAEHEGLEIVR